MKVSLRVILRSRFPTLSYRLTFWFNREMMIGWGTVYQWDVSLLVTQRHVTNLILLEGVTKKHYRVSIGDPIFQSFDPATFFCKEIPHGTGLTFCGVQFCRANIFPLWLVQSVFSFNWNFSFCSKFAGILVFWRAVRQQTALVGSFWTK